MDRETVITHLQIIHTWAEFARERDLQFFTTKHLEDIAKWSDDAIELLKEQEAVEPKQVDLYGKDEWWGLVCVCPDCKAEWMSDKADTHFCPKCGRSVKWTM
jgi:hypothetical protein